MKHSFFFHKRNVSLASYAALAVFAAVFLLSHCGKGMDEREARARKAAKNKGNIVIGVVSPLKLKPAIDSYRQGIELALEELNGFNKVLGRKIEIIHKDDEGMVDKGRIIAQEFSSNPDMTAVIGHYNSYISLQTAIIYEYYGLLMMSPHSRSPEFPWQSFHLVFQNAVSDEKSMREIMQYLKSKKLNRFVVYYVKDAYGYSLAQAFEKCAQDFEISIVDSRSFDPSSHARYFANDLKFWKSNFSFDGIFIACLSKEGIEIISEARKLGMKTTFICGPGLATRDLLGRRDVATEGTIVATYFHPNDPRPEVKKFNESYEKKYGYAPDSEAALGYDTLHVLAEAMIRAGTTVPEKVAEELRRLKNWSGATGLHNFNLEGEVTGKSVYICVVRNNRLELIQSSEPPL
ncbi:MAG: hypothetical protein EHM45_09760 [Desulfobacteraceae bacterium]|nr:MAG: hypothetical protein EHM45_09760 [Desulfobacteraceae bacterium]